MINMLINHRKIVNRHDIQWCLECNNTKLADYFYPKMTGKFDDYDEDFWPNVHSVESAKWAIEHNMHTTNAIESALRNNNFDILKYLIEEAHLPVAKGILINIVYQYPDLEIIDYLIEHGAEINYKDKEHFSVMSRAPDYQQYFIERGYK